MIAIPDDKKSIKAFVDSLGPTSGFNAEMRCLGYRDVTDALSQAITRARSGNIDGAAQAAIDILLLGQLADNADVTDREAQRLGYRDSDDILSKVVLIGGYSQVVKALRNAEQRSSSRSERTIEINIADAVQSLDEILRDYQCEEKQNE